MLPIRKKIRSDYCNLREALENDVPLAVPEVIGYNYPEDGHDVAAAPIDEHSQVEATLQPQTIAKAAFPSKEGGRTKKKRRSRKKATLCPKIKMPSPRIMKMILMMKPLMTTPILRRRMKRPRRTRIQNSVRILQNSARRPQCPPFQS